MNKNNKKLAFTLPEVVVTLSITVIVLAMVTSLAIIVTNITQTQNYNQSCQAEYQKASDFVGGFASNYSYGNWNFDIAQTTNGYEISVTNSSQTYKLAYDKIASHITAQMYDLMSGSVNQETITLERITNIVFTKQNNLIKCEYSFQNYNTITNLVVFGVSQ